MHHRDPGLGIEGFAPSKACPFSSKADIVSPPRQLFEINIWKAKPK
jgi:hypothetical protein